MDKKQTELRYDLLTNDWIIVSPKRRLRHEKIIKCPFCNIHEQKKPFIIFNKGEKTNSLKEWTTVVIPNKYPVFEIKEKTKQIKENDFYLKLTTPGFHDIVVTKEHNKPMAKLSINRIKEVIDCYKERYIDLKKYDFVKHILIFHNHGKEAGASQKHPHSQILTSPLIDKEFNIILSNAREYFNKNKQCLQCKINELEIRNKKRIVFENEDFIAFCPFAPKFLFQVIVSPKNHFSCFEDITDKQSENLAQVFKELLSMYDIVLDNPSYNFYLHTSPCKENNCFPYFHWYWSFFPRISKLAGFEMGANMEIITIRPEEQAMLLRNRKHV